MAGTVMVRIEGIKTIGSLTHDLGNRNNLDYVDQSKSHLNTIVMGQSFEESKALFKHQKESIIQNFNYEKDRQRELVSHEFLDNKEYKKERRRIRNWQSHMNSHLRGIIGFGQDAKANFLSHQLMDQCARDYVNKLCENHNLEALYLVRHMDETAVHYHFVTTNYNFGNHKTLRLTRDDLRKEQDKIGEAFSPLGLSRGVDKQERLKQAALKLDQPLENGKYSADVWKEANVINRSVKQLHEDLPFEIEEKQKEIEKIEIDLKAQQKKLEKNKRLIEKNEHKLSMLDIKKAGALVEQEKIEKRLKSYQKRVNDAQAEIDRLSLKIKPIKASTIEYVTGYEEKHFGSPKPIVKKAKVVSPRKANEFFKKLKAKEIKLKQEQKRIQEQRLQQREEQQQAQQELELFFAKQSYKHMMVFGKQIESRDELINFVKWFEQESGWVTTNIGTRFKVQKENGEVVRIVVENTEGHSDFQKAETLLLAASKSEMDSGYFNGSDEMFLEFWKLHQRKTKDIDFELLLTEEQEQLLQEKGLTKPTPLPPENSMEMGL